jgi:hypothetical protein
VIHSWVGFGLSALAAALGLTAFLMALAQRRRIRRRQLYDWARENPELRHDGGHVRVVGRRD